MLKTRNAVALCTLLIGSTLAQSQEMDKTLQKIKASGAIVVGFHSQSFPLSFLDERKAPVGFAQDVVTEVHNAVMTHLGYQNIAIQRVPITMRNRFDYVANGVVDIECNSTTNTRERQKSFAFSNSFFIATTKLLTRKELGIKDYKDLAGKTVLVNDNSTSQQLLKKWGADNKIQFEFVLNTEHSAPITMLESGQASAFMLDDILLYGFIANAQRPQDWIVTGAPMSREAYACTMRKDSPLFKGVVDRAITTWMVSGKAMESYKKWFQSTITSSGINLSFPISSDMESLFRAPNDSAFD